MGQSLVIMAPLAHLYSAVSQSKQIYIAPCVASKSETCDDRD